MQFHKTRWCCELCDNIPMRFGWVSLIRVDLEVIRLSPFKNNGHRVKETFTTLLRRDSTIYILSTFPFWNICLLPCHVHIYIFTLYIYMEEQHLTRDRVNVTIIDNVIRWPTKFHKIILLQMILQLENQFINNKNERNSNSTHYEMV